MFNFVKELIKKYIKGSQYKKNVLVMIIGRTIAQAIPILLTPLLTRIYSPEDFGIFGVFAAIIAIVAMASNGRYCLSIILPKEEEKSRRLFALSTFLTIATTIAFAIVLIFTGTSLFEILNTPVLSNYLWIIVLNMLFIGLYEAVYYYALRVKAFKILTTNIIIQALVLITSRLIFGYLEYTEFGLMLSYLLGYTVSYILMLIRLKMPIGKLLGEFNLGMYVKLMKEYYKFPKFSLPADTLNTVSNMAPNVLISKAFGTVTNGYYNMTDKILGSPLWLVTSSVGDVFRQEASEQFRTKGSCFDVFKKTTRATFLLGIIPFGLLFIFAPYIVTPILGEEWSEIGDFIRIFSLMYFVKFIVRPVSSVLYIVRKQDFNAIFQTIHLLAVVIGFVIGIVTKDLYLCLISWSLLSSISYIIILFFSYRFAKNTRYDPNED